MPGSLQPATRRGIAMMLVLVSLALATILASAYLASRDNSLLIGQNSAASAAARWAALSALETTVAVMQTETDWRINHADGVLLDSYPLAGATVTVTVRDAETGGPPTAFSEYFELTATASVDADGDGRADGIQTTTLEAYVPCETEPRVAMDLAEFAVLARDDIWLSDTATLARWPNAPLSRLGRRIAIGTKAVGSGSIQVVDSAACIDTTAYYQDGASSTIVFNASGPHIVEVEQPFEIPFFPGPRPGVSYPDGFSRPDLVLYTGDTAIVNTDRRYHDVWVDTGELTISGDVTIVCDDDFVIDDGGRVFIDGNVKIVAFDDLDVMDGGALELRPGASLTLHIGNDTYLRDGYIGDERTDDVRDHTGQASYMNPLRIRYFTIDDTSVVDHTWTMELNSVVKGSIFGRPLVFTMYNDSAVYGRVAAYDVFLNNNCAIFYDHALDEQQGYIHPDSLLIDPDTGALDGAYLAISRLDPAEIQALADATGTVIYANGWATPPSAAPPADPPPGPGAPTPRPVDVAYEITSFGMDMSQWEQANGQHAGP
jgi:hypothetical protein